MTQSTLINRRHMLAGSLVIGAGTIAAPRMAFAAAPGERNVLFAMLRGAADGMAMLAPVGDPNFAKLRGTHLGEYENARKADGFFAIHPAFESIGAAYGAGEAAFVHATATSYRERSHFDGQNLLETGATAPYATTEGWLNRLTALIASEHGSGMPKALAIAPTVPLALRGPAPSSSYAPSNLPEASEAFIDRVSRLYGADKQLGELWSQALSTREMAGDDTLRNLRDAKAAGELAASLMREKNGARIAMIDLGGWDSHANQPGQFRRQAGQLDTLLGAYKAAMGTAWDNTLVMVVTEFGRTAALNGTNGTDHGTASAAIVTGGTVKGGQVIADWPGLGESQLYQARDLKPTISLESVLAGAVAGHMKIDAKRSMDHLFPGRETNPLTGLIRA